MSAAEPLVRIEAVRALAGDSGCGLEEVDLAFGAGEVWVAFGREGAGTSELLRAVAGVAKLVTGRITVLGWRWARARRGTAGTAPADRFRLPGDRAPRQS